MSHVWIEIKYKLSDEALSVGKTFSGEINHTKSCCYFLVVGTHILNHNYHHFLIELQLLVSILVRWLDYTKMLFITKF